MTRESLILFIERILQSGSEQKAFGALHELHEILTRQNADNGLISLVKQTMDNVSDAREAAKTELTETALRDAISRGEARRLYESMMQHQGRCG